MDAQVPVVASKELQSYGPFFLEYSLLAEYNLMLRQKMPGVYVIPSANSPLCWFGVLFIRQGIYQEGIFRFKVLIPENYPHGGCPRVVFDHFVYHPLVDPDSFELDVKREFLHWQGNVNHIWQLLLHARRMFYKIDTSGAPSNKGAAETFAADLASYKCLAQTCVTEWKSRLFDHSEDARDPHYLIFSPHDPDLHDPCTKAMMEAAAHRTSSVLQARDSRSFTSSSDSGLSFIKPGSLEIFSRDSS